MDVDVAEELVPVIGGVTEGGSLAEVGDLVPAVIDQHGLELGEVLRTHEDVCVRGAAWDDGVLVIDDAVLQKFWGDSGAFDV